MREPGRYTKEFKTEAIRLMDSGDRPISDIAMELGIKRTLLYRWRDQSRQKGEAAFSNKLGRPKNEDLGEMARQRKEKKYMSQLFPVFCES